jgi:hypothetical protein
MRARARVTSRLILTNDYNARVHVRVINHFCEFRHGFCSYYAGEMIVKITGSIQLVWSNGVM